MQQLILAIDLGKFKSVACTYDPSTGEHTFNTLATTPTAMHDHLVEVQPSRVVIEVGSAAGWLKDLCEALELPIQIAVSVLRTHVPLLGVLADDVRLWANCNEMRTSRRSGDWRSASRIAAA